MAAIVQILADICLFVEGGCSGTVVTQKLEKLVLACLYSAVNNTEPLNMIILLTKVYVFKCSQNNAPLNLKALKSKLKKHYIEKKLLARLNNKEESFTKRWEIWSHMIDSE